MRYDMSEVLIERPRKKQYAGKTPKKSRRRLNPCVFEDLPTKEPVERLWQVSGQTKEFSDLLGPLRRFLLSRVGRPWNEVYSEIRERISPNSQLQLHLLKHIMDYVETNVVLIHGKPFTSDGREEIVNYAKHFRLYVHPVSRILLKAPHENRKRAPEAQCLWADKKLLTQYHQVGGIWYLVTLKTFLPERICYSRVGFMTSPYYDIILKQKVYSSCFDVFNKIYGGDYYAVAKRQINSSEIKRAGLRKELT